jgi:UDP-GlcNAc:undecaprenyl-phosphate/decaprenyl-phosphate GlcNAc-1-phosphate transferase
MMQSWIWYPFGLAALGGAVLTVLVMRLAWRFGAVARPRADRWHQRPTALLGGTAIYVASITAAAVTLAHGSPVDHGSWMRLVGFGAAATLVFAVGLVDDLRHLSPSVKGVGQTVAACLLVMSGIQITCVPWAWLAVPLTIFWVVGITNAVNLLDNMDGVAAGVVAIAALGMAATGAAGGQSQLVILALCLAGACCGFLLYNFHPARIFMGDCGSLYLGFTISVLALLGTMGPVSNLTAALIVPVAVLAIPIFDTTLVTTARWLHGRPVSQGGRDHTTHRLVALGLSETRVALLLYAGSGALSALALAASPMPPVAVVPLAGLVLLVLGLFGAFLGMVPVYSVERGNKGGLARSPQTVSGRGAASRRVPSGSGVHHLPQPGSAGQRSDGPTRVPLLSGRRFGNRALARVMLDVALVPIAFALAHVLRFDAAVPQPILQRAQALLPVWIVFKTIAMVGCRTHRGLWRYAGVADVIAALRGSTLGSLAALASVAVAGDFTNFSRSVFILDWLLFTTLALLVRLAFVLLKHTFSTISSPDVERVVVVGADESGLATARRLRDSRTRQPVGFVDDDDVKHRCTLDGLPVLGGLEDLPRLVRQAGARAVVIPAQSGSADRATVLCSAYDIPYTRGSA